MSAKDDQRPRGQDTKLVPWEPGLWDIHRPCLLCTVLILGSVWIQLRLKEALLGPACYLNFFFFTLITYQSRASQYEHNLGSMED